MPSKTEAPVANETAVLPSSGIVKWFDTNKGYGFIQLNGGGANIFLHVKELRKCGILALNDGAPVSFTAIKGPKGYYATRYLKPSPNRKPAIG